MAAVTDMKIDPAVLATALIEDTKEPVTEAAKPEVEAPVIEKAGDFTDLIDRLTKGDFGGGSWDAAHNGNELDKSSPAGDKASFTAGVTTAEDAQRNVDGAEARVANSVKRSRATVPTAAPTTLNKGEEDGEMVKSDDEINEEDIYGDLVDGDGAEGYVPVAEASEAIQYMTDTFAKAMTHISAQLAAFSTELHGRVDSIEKSQAVLREASAALLKSNAARAEEPIKKSMLTSAPAPVPASGIVVVNGKADEEKKTAPATGVLFKSIAKLMSKNEISPEVGTRLLGALDSRGAAQVWESLTSEQREKINSADKN